MADDARLRTVDEHLAIVLDGIGSIDPIELTLLDAQGLLLAENVSTEFPLPSFDNSAMDGYAVRAIDTRDASANDPTRLQVVGDIAAGAKTRSGMGPGLAMRIMTGAPIPAGADAVIPLEDTDRGVARVAINRPVRTGECLRRAGEDLAAGVPALGAGAALGPQQLALLAALGRDRVTVRPRPRVIILSTGSELIEVGHTPAFGEVIDSNSYMIAAAAKDAGADARRIGIVADD
ncbi:MAG: molybdopterin molybdotransferase MoeA, partial [Actinomycetota bacterium]|nr:molybdopterin molybdotransferase MoeA [Actinomycetota bacterium]